MMCGTYSYPIPLLFYFYFSCASNLIEGFLREENQNASVMYSTLEGRRVWIEQPWEAALCCDSISDIDMSETLPTSTLNAHLQGIKPLSNIHFNNGYSNSGVAP